MGVYIGEINKKVQKLGDWRGLEVWQKRDLGVRRGNFWGQYLVIFEDVGQKHFWKGII